MIFSSKKFVNGLDKKPFKFSKFSKKIKFHETNRIRFFKVILNLIVFIFVDFLYKET